MPSYKQYLQSDEWKDLSAKARERSGYSCEFCGGKPDHVHHVTYPKNRNYSLDCIENLVVCCGSCHAKQHGIRGSVMNEISVIDFEGSKVCCTDAQGRLWVRFDDLEKPFGLIGNGWGYRHEQELEHGEDWVRMENPLTRKIEIFLSEEGVLCLGMRFGGNQAARRLRKKLAAMALNQAPKQDDDVPEDMKYLVAMVNKMIEHKRQIDANTQQIDYLGQENQKIWAAISEQKTEIEDYLTASDYLRKNGVNASEKDFGQFISATLRTHGCTKTDAGWFNARGEQLSKSFPAPETRYARINKWKISVLDYCVKLFVKEKTITYQTQI